MSVTKVQQTAEAICGALARLDWEYIGDSDQGASTWFIRGEKPKQVRIEVQRSHLAYVVNVNVEWFNLSIPGRVIRGRQSLHTQCDASVADMDVIKSTERNVLRCLEIMKDVVSGEGVASRSYVETLPA